MLQERESLHHEVQEEKVNFTIKMPDYKMAYSMPRLEDNVSSNTEEVFIHRKQRTGR